MEKMHAHTLLGLMVTTGMLMTGCETTDMDSGSTISSSQSPAAQAAPMPASEPMAAAEPPAQPIRTEEPARASEPTPSVTIQTSPSQTSSSRNGPAAGAADDSLTACMTRIPSDSTASQRMLAERTCQRDEEVRKPFGDSRR